MIPRFARRAVLILSRSTGFTFACMNHTMKNTPQPIDFMRRNEPDSFDNNFRLTSDDASRRSGSSDSRDPGAVVDPTEAGGGWGGVSPALVREVDRSKHDSPYMRRK